MADYTDPVERTFELQRRSIEQSQEALERTLTLPARVGEAALDSLDSQESVQRDVVELQQEAIRSFLDAVEETFPGAETSTRDLRETVDDQYDTVLESHAAFFENLSSSLEEGVDAYDELSDETLVALEDLVDSLVDAQAELEDQSIEATEQVETQLEELQTQVENVQDQVRDGVDDDTAES